MTQNIKQTVQNGPVGQKVKQEGARTSSEFRDLANARQTPDQPAVTGQPLTHYHSMFYRLLSWKNPRATGITFAVTVLFIFAARYLDILRYVLRALYMVLGITAGVEIAGKAVLGEGVATRMRPKKYFVIPKESLERFLDDFEQLINFFVIEFQRVVFVENVWVTVGAFLASFISYWLVRIVPLWGLTLIGDSIIFLAPLVYINNKEFIDEHLRNAHHRINEQTAQLKDLAAQHTGHAQEVIGQYAGQSSAKIQELIGTAQHRVRQKTGGAPVKSSDLPDAPGHEPASATTTGAEKQAQPAM
jgi:ABC-type multidrug transport system fused ATPase/permease subunit